MTEGDSAKALAVAGLDVVGRDQYGVFPLRGKLLNVREASAAQLTGNTEIQNIREIMGLKHGKVYTNREELRYGSLMIMTDQVCLRRPVAPSADPTSDPSPLRRRFRITMDRTLRASSSTTLTTFTRRCSSLTASSLSLSRRSSR